MKTKKNGQLKKSKNFKLNQTFNEKNQLTIQFLTILKRLFYKKLRLVSYQEMSKRFPNVEVCEMKIFCK